MRRDSVDRRGSEEVKRTSRNNVGCRGVEDEQFFRYNCNFSSIIIHIPLLTSVSYPPLSHLYV